MESWLIELEGPKWAGFVDGKSEWTINPNRALRFARKEDADNFKAFWCETAKSTEHTQLLVPEIEGTFPVVLYFGKTEDRDELIALVQEAKPGMVAKKL
jgi:hypothetical protein